MSIIYMYIYFFKQVIVYGEGKVLDLKSFTNNNIFLICEWWESQEQ